MNRASAVNPVLLGRRTTNADQIDLGAEKAQIQQLFGKPQIQICIPEPEQQLLIDSAMDIHVRNTFIHFTDEEGTPEDIFQRSRGVQSCPSSRIGCLRDTFDQEAKEAPGMEDPRTSTTKTNESCPPVDQYESGQLDAFHWPTTPDPVLLGKMSYIHENGGHAGLPRHRTPMSAAAPAWMPQNCNQGMSVRGTVLDLSQLLPEVAPTHPIHPAPPQSPQTMQTEHQTYWPNLSFSMLNEQSVSSHYPPSPVLLPSCEPAVQARVIYAPSLQDPIIDFAPPTFEVPAPTHPAPGSAELPSIGSAGHLRGECKPCAFLHTKGCDNGAVCRFCHLCDAGEKKRRQKEKKVAFKGGA